ncbi:MAG: hypothetical protein IJD14_02260 [Christensenellaceae bacterium]|nr:hypothetical protein [Christensenellaceae bacterium]
MEKYISEKKLSKKKRKELEKERRVMWNFDPHVRVKKSAKVYDRKKLGHITDDTSFFFYA